MGTSTAYGGPGGSTPLIPSWLGPSGAPPSPVQAPGLPDGSAPIAPPPRPANPAPFQSNRFAGPRANVTRFAGSGGRDRKSLGRAVAGYVSSATGGATAAAQRMGASRGSGARLFGFLQDVRLRGSAEALRTLNLGHLSGRSLAEIFTSLADYVSPAGGGLDEAIARDAFIETIADLTELGVVDLDALTAEQMQTVFELHLTHAIVARLCNDIGMKAITMPQDAAAALRLQNQIFDFIRRGVSDALVLVNAATASVPQSRVQSFVDEVYGQAFEILRQLGDAEERR